MWEALRESAQGEMRWWDVRHSQPVWRIENLFLHSFCVTFRKDSSSPCPRHRQPLPFAIAYRLSSQTKL